MMTASWNYSRSAEGSGSWLEYLRDPFRPTVAGDGPVAIVEAMDSLIPGDTLRLIGSPESLVPILGAGMHPSNSLLDASGIRLSAAFTWSRADVLATMGGMGVPMQELMTEARSQSQKEAVLQFQIAREAFLDRRFPESLEAVSRALDTGPSLMAAGRLVWRIHFLRALLLLGSDHNTDPDLVDPTEAEQSFLLAARYAKTEYRVDAARALLGAGWAAYVNGKGEVQHRMRTAATYTGEALDLDGDLAEAQFQAAKLRMALGEPDAALYGLRWLPLSARVLLLKAAADGDFQRHSAKLEGFLRTLRDEQLTKIRSQVSPVGSRIRQWMADCPELAETPAARRIVDLSESSEHQGLLEVHRYFEFEFPDDHETLRNSFFEAKRTVSREWDEEVVDPARDADPWSGIILDVDKETEFQFINGLGEVLASYRGVPGFRKEFPMSLGDSPVVLAAHWIPPGRFLMGSPIDEPDRESDEMLHAVFLPDGFFFSETPCTQAQWSLFMPENPSRFRGTDLPVEQVDWDEAREFARLLTEFHLRSGLIPEGWHWDLPTEAQWEYACRVRKPGEYHGPVEDVAWYQRNSRRRTQPVGRKQANEWGLHDMHGNVGKWCLDWYGPYPVGDVTDPAGPSVGTFRVYRGGSWSHVAGCCRSACRGRSVPEFRSSNIGFSLVLSSLRDEEPEAATSR